MIKIIKEYSQCLFAVLISTLIIVFSLCLLAHNIEVSPTSFSASQIYEMTDTDKENSKISSKIKDELVHVIEN